MKTTLKIYLMLSLFALSTNLIAEERDTIKVPSKVAFYDVRGSLEKILVNHINNKGFEGTVIISNESGTIYNKSHGFSIEEVSKYDSSTPVDIASVSKQFTAATIMKLVDQGKLRIEDKISKYVMDVPTDKSQITIHDLLTHTAGFKRHSGRDEERIGKDKFVKRVMAQPLAFNVGEKYHYSNIGYGLLAYIVEEVSGFNFETYLYKNLLEPAGMYSTGYLRPEWPNHALPEGEEEYAGFGNSIEMIKSLDGNFWNLIGGGGIYSSAKDMQRWHVALMEGKILSYQSQELMYKPHVPEEDGYFYGYGWSIVPKPGKEKLVWHNGMSFFGKAEYWRLPKTGMMIFVASHKRDVSPWQVARDIYNALQK